MTLLSGNPTKKTVSQLGDLALQVNVLELQFETWGDEILRTKTDEVAACPDIIGYYAEADVRTGKSFNEVYVSLVQSGVSYILEYIQG